MAKMFNSNASVHVSIPKKTSQSGSKARCKMSSMNKHKKRSYKAYAGQGK